MTTHAPVPLSVPRPQVGLTLAAAGPLAIGAILAARAQDLAPIAAVPAIVFGVLAATSPALYIAIAATGDAPPLRSVARAVGVALGAFGVALAGLVLPAAFLALSSIDPVTTIVLCSCALGGAAALAAWRLATELQTRRVSARLLFHAWALATVGIAGRLWWDLAHEVMS
jgi:hypothetical protein